MSGKKIPKINFNLSQSNHCCGIQEIGGFEFQSGTHVDWKAPITPPKKYTPKEVLKLFDEDLEFRINDLKEDLWGTPSPGGILIQASFVITNAGHMHEESPDFLFLLEHLKTKHEFKEVANFVNFNSGNRIVQIQKYVELMSAE